ncbi:KAP family P-loop NTPase fold protein [Vibrio fluvialis]
MSNIHQICQSETFDKYPIIDRHSYSLDLTDYILHQVKNSDRGFVVNLNAEWGAGKTTFLQCWYNDLKHKHPVVYFDAWKSDFTHDAMLAILEAFQQQLMSPLTENKELIRAVIDKGRYFIKAALPSLMANYLKKMGGLDSDESLFDDIADQFGIDGNNLDDALKDTLKEILAQKQKVSGIHEFKLELEKLKNAYLATYSKFKGPVFVLIDELDRCRPTYAIEVIECVKHFFDIDDFAFVLATDTEQLQHSIKAIYGEGFNSSGYLSRFFDRTVTLPAPTTKEYIKTRLTSIVGHFPKDDYQIDTLIDSIFIWHGMSSIREIEKVFRDLEVATSKSGNFKIIPLLCLSILKHRFPKVYQTLKDTGEIPYGTGNQNNYLKQAQTTEPFNLSYDHLESVSYILFCAIHHIDDTPEKSYQYVKMQSLHNQSTTLITNACVSLCATYGTKDKYNLRPLRDYYAVINFAGHISNI